MSQKPLCYIDINTCIALGTDIIIGIQGTDIYTYTHRRYTCIYIYIVCKDVYRYRDPPRLGIERPGVSHSCVPSAAGWGSRDWRLGASGPPRHGRRPPKLNYNVITKNSMIYDTSPYMKKH